MPSDCQCSACGVERVVEMKVLNNKQATIMLRKLQAEVEQLREENADLSAKLKKSTANKKSLIDSLKRQLDRI